MYLLQLTENVYRTEGDACLSCDRWPCQKVQTLEQTLREGVHLDLIFCPDRRPPLGTEENHHA